jgi:DeoR/GlpR family transcriptional regulator of sugar metabolism
MTRITKEKRHQKILAELTLHPATRLSELAQSLRVSRETIRRDLDELSSNGIISRTYGGAIVHPRGGEEGLRVRDSTFVGQRSAIAATAASLIAPNEVIMLSTGSSTLHFARYIASSQKPLTIITSGIDVAMVLAVNPEVRTILAPGDYDARESRVWGAETTNFLRKFQADTAIIGASGLFPGGACEADSPTAWVDRVMLERAHRRILLILHTKFDQPKLELICPLNQLDIIISDRAPEGELLEAIKSADVTLKIAESPRVSLAEVS